LKGQAKMSRKNIAACLAVIILVTSFFSGCKSSGKHGDFYPYRLSDYVTLGDYTKIDYNPLKISVTDQDVDNEIRARFKANGLTTMQEKADAIETGDTAIINYVGYLNGKTFEGGSAQNSALEIGSGRFIDGF
jgi:trigger factor